MEIDRRDTTTNPLRVEYLRHHVPMFTIDQVITEYYPHLNDKPIALSIIKPILRHLLHEKAFVDFSKQYPHLHGIDFIEQVFDYFQFSYSVADRDINHIPSFGGVMIIANHPIGSLDGLALLKLVHEVRSDVRIVANDLLAGITPLRSLLLPVRVLTGNSGKEHILRIGKALENGEAVIIFPAGEVSRISPKGIRDGRWRGGFLKIAERAKVPILPIHIEGRNSILFYFTSILAKPLSTLMLVGEMFRQQSRLAKITIGAVIPHEAYRSLPLNPSEKIRLFKKHLYRIGVGKKPLFTTTKAIARPERKADLKKAVREGEMLGTTPDGKSIYLFLPVESSPVMREIGRLRELTFRAVGEGTGQRRDLDHFDWYYHHLILWDEDDLEIAGAYRFVDACRVVAEKGPEGLYSCSLFNLNQKELGFVEQGLELGRSFVQQRYWGNRSLDYLWYGIGAFLVKNPQYRYLFGPVSISNTMPRFAKELLIYFYKLYFSGTNGIACSRNPFVFSEPLTSLEKEFCGNDYRSDFRKLKAVLANLGTTVPPLYKQYSELCDPGGVVFLDFNIDPGFNNCVDGLVIVDTEQLRQQKRQRYMGKSILR